MSARLWITWTAAAALLLGGVGTVVRSQPEGPAEPLGMAWSRPIERVVEVAVSPQGDRVLALDLDGRIRCFDRRGAVLWERVVSNADRLAVSERGDMVLAYGLRQPLNRRLTFLDGEGRTTATLEVPEAIQAVVVSQDGRIAAAACGKKLVICSLRNGLRHRVIPLSAEPHQLQSGPADSVYVAFRGEGGIRLVKSTGKVLWSRRGRPGPPPSICASADGKLLAVGEELPEDQVEVSLLTSANERRWSVARPGRSPLVRLSAAGAAVMLAYEHKVEHNQLSRFERRLAYLAAVSGRSPVEETWTKGGAFTAPRYISVDGEGDWVVALDETQAGQGRPRQPNFRLYGRAGERRWIYSSPAEILFATSSRDGRSIATYRADGVLEMVRVSAL